MTARSPTERNMRGARLPLCARGVSVPTSTKPKPMAEQLARHARILVEACRHADRIGEIEAEQTLRQALVVGRVGARIKSELEALDGEIVRPLGRQREQQALA